MTVSQPVSRFNSEEMAEALKTWVACESPTNAPDGVNRMMDIVQKTAEAASLGVTRIPGRDGLGDMLCIEAGPRSGEKPYLLLSHLDTVHPVGTLANDLPIRREGDFLYGPGVFDMKGGAYLAFAAMLDVARRGTAARPIKFLFTSDEEIGSPTSRAPIEDLARKAEAVLVTEPARDGGHLVTARKGVGRFDVEIEGVPAHSGARHERGRSAIKEAARQILFIEGLTDYARGVTTTVGLISGGSAANVIPRQARFSVDLRITNVADGEHYAALIRNLKAHDPDCKLTITGDINRPPMERSEPVLRLYEKVRSIAAGVGLDLGEVPMTGGASDANFTAVLGIPTIDGLGIIGDGAHTLQEYGAVSSLAPRAEVLARLLETA